MQITTTITPTAAGYNQAALRKLETFWLLLVEQTEAVASVHQLQASSANPDLLDKVNAAADSACLAVEAMRQRVKRYLQPVAPGVSPHTSAPGLHD